MCAPGSQNCGPCMPQYQETPSGSCILKFPDGRSKFIGPDAIIDLVHNMLDLESKRIKGQESGPTNPELASTVPYKTVSGTPTSSTSSSPLPVDNNSSLAGSKSPSDSTSPPRGLDRRVNGRRRSDINQTVSLTLVVICSLTGVSGIFVAALCWYRLQKEVRLAQKMAYTAYKGSRHQACHKGADNIPQYIQEYQNQKKKLQAKEGSEVTPRQLSTDSEAEVEGFTIYECPGLAPTGEMEVHNPLFDPSREDP
ncbi:neural proliferation differentiation and control protein 1-like isoform 2-T3 [Discoglossus pictus]